LLLSSAGGFVGEQGISSAAPMRLLRPWPPGLYILLEVEAAVWWAPWARQQRLLRARRQAALSSAAQARSGPGLDLGLRARAGVIGSHCGGGFNAEGAGGRWRRAEVGPNLGLVGPERATALARDGGAGDHISSVAAMVVSLASTSVLRGHSG
jgi:hypothetical protein